MVELIDEFQPAHIAIEMPFLVRIPLRLTSDGTIRASVLLRRTLLASQAVLCLLRKLWVASAFSAEVSRQQEEYYRLLK